MCVNQQFIQSINTKSPFTLRYYELCRLQSTDGKWKQVLSLSAFVLTYLAAEEIEKLF